MKTSNILLLSVAGVIILSILALSFRMRANLNQSKTHNIPHPFNLANFDKIEANGDIAIHIVKSDTFKINFYSEHNRFKEFLKVNKEDNTLKIVLDDYDHKDKVEAIINMPAICQIKTDGNIRVNLREFISEKLKLEVTGRSHINLRENQLDSLTVTSMEDGSINHRSGNAQFVQLTQSGESYCKLSGGEVSILKGNLKDSSYANVRCEVKKFSVETSEKARISKN